MAEIFISYKSERRPAAEHMAGVLAAHGWSVWWDYGLVSGRDFGAQIETELRAARAVVVLWCGRSRESEWVKEEAGLAKRLGTLLPVTIEPVDIPLGFSMAQTIDLSDWDGAPASPAIERLLHEIERFTGHPAASDPQKLARVEHDWREAGAPSLPAFPLIGAIERDRPPRTLPWTLDNPPPAPSRGKLSRTAALAGAGAIVAAGAAALALTPWRDAERESATERPSVASAASAPARISGPENPAAPADYSDATARQAIYNAACAPPAQRWFALRPRASEAEMSAFFRTIPPQCTALMTEVLHVKGRLLSASMDDLLSNATERRRAAERR